MRKLSIDEEKLKNIMEEIDNNPNVLIGLTIGILSFICLLLGFIAFLIGSKNSTWGIMMPTQVIGVLGFQIMSLIIGLLGIMYGRKVKKTIQNKEQNSITRIGILLSFFSIIFASFFFVVMFIGF